MVDIGRIYPNVTGVHDHGGAIHLHGGGGRGMLRRRCGHPEDEGGMCARGWWASGHHGCGTGHRGGRGLDGCPKGYDNLAANPTAGVKEEAVGTPLVVRSRGRRHACSRLYVSCAMGL